METACLILILCLLNCIMLLTLRVFNCKVTKQTERKAGSLAYHEAIVEGVALSEKSRQWHSSSNDVYSLLHTQSELERWERKIQRLTQFEVIESP